MVYVVDLGCLRGHGRAVLVGAAVVGVAAAVPGGPARQQPSAPAEAHLEDMFHISVLFRFDSSICIDQLSSSVYSYFLRTLSVIGIIVRKITVALDSMIARQLWSKESSCSEKEACKWSLQ